MSAPRAESTQSLADKVIVVAGAAGAAGPPACGELLRRGATVIGADANATALDALHAELPALRPAVVDLLDDAATAAWADALRTEHGHIDGLVHLVGGWRGGTLFTEEDLGDWQFLADLLVRTLQHTSRAFHSALSESAAGRLVIVSAKQASKPTAKNAHYAAAKAAAEAWTLAVAHSWKASSTAAAAILVVNGLVTDAMRAAKPEAGFTTMTDVADVATAIAGLWDAEPATLNGERLWLTP